LSAFRFAHPAVLLALPALAALVAWLETRLPASPGRRAARAVARVAILALLVGALAGPGGGGSRSTARRLVLLVDGTLGAEGRSEAREAAEAAVAVARAEGTEVTWIPFARAPGAPRALGGGDPVPEPPPAPGEVARLAPALAAAHLAFRPMETGRVLLLTDGHGDGEGAAAAGERLRDAGVAVDARAVPASVPAPPPRPRVTAIEAPERARGPFDVRVALSAPAAVEVSLWTDRKVVDRRRVEGAEGGVTVAFADVEVPPGLHEVTVLLSDPESGEAQEATRRLVEVGAPPRALAVLADPLASPVRRALSAQGFQVTVAPPEALAEALSANGPRPDAVVLDADSAVLLPPDVATALVLAVEEGLGLYVVAGGAEAWTALATSPLGAVLPLEPLPPPPPPPPAPAPSPPPAAPRPSPEPPKPDGGPGLRAERRPEEALPISLLLIVDRSGSMEGLKLAMAVEGGRRAAAALAPSDRVAVITFADDATLDVPPMAAGALGNLAWRLAFLEAGGNTDIYGALRRGAEVLEAERAPIRHLVLLTDGRQTTTEALFGPLMRRLSAAGITTTAVGLGPTHDEVLLKTIVQYGPGGRYVPVDSPGEIPTILTRDTQRVHEARRAEAVARGLVQDPRREPLPPPEEPEEPAPPPPPEAPPPAPAEEGDLARPLVLLRPHEATRGLAPDEMPAVGAPLRSRVAGPAALLIAREGRSTAGAEPVLAARRVGLGRVLAFALPPDAVGLEAWAGQERVHVQGVRAVMAPEGAFAGTPELRLSRTPEGERLRVEVDPGAGSRTLALTWHGPDGPVALGPLEVPTPEDHALPAAPAGTVAGVTLEDDEGRLVAPPLTYLVAEPADEGPRAGDPYALARLLGRSGPDEAPAAASPVGATPVRTAWWPWWLAAALLLLPFDVALHRRSIRRSTRGRETPT
jgi:hypothetical protein